MVTHRGGGENPVALVTEPAVAQPSPQAALGKGAAGGGKFRPTMGSGVAFGAAGGVRWILLLAREAQGDAALPDSSWAAMCSD
jgi:hypothetical protein